MATEKQTGDYRRVSKDVWIKFSEYYKNSGPTIKATFALDPISKSNGIFDTSSWDIDHTDFTSYLKQSGMDERKIKEKMDDAKKRDEKEKQVVEGNI